MANAKKPEKHLPKPEFGKISLESQPEKIEVKENAEVKEHSDSELGQLKKEIENTEIDDHLHQSAKTNAQSMQSLAADEKVQQLLMVAKDKGVVFAVKVAQKMNDPYVLDALHDMLAKNGYYKEFLK